MPPFERSYLNDTFLHTGLGIAIIGITARTLHMSGWSYRLMSANPWLVLGIGLVGSIGTMMGCRMTAPENYMVKYPLWVAFNMTQAALLSPLMFFSPAILATSLSPSAILARCVRPRRLVPFLVPWPLIPP